MKAAGRRRKEDTPSRQSARMRWQAAAAVAAVFDGKSLADAMPAAVARVRPEDHSTLRELAFGTVRWAVRLEALLANLMDRPLKHRDLKLKALLLVGLYQIEYTRIPDYAAVGETVAAARFHGGRPWAGGLVNGVLRGFLRRRDELVRELDRHPTNRFAHPAWLIDRLRADWPDDWERMTAANNERPPMTLRIATDRISRDTWLDTARERAIDAMPVAHLPSAVTLAQPLDVAHIPGFEEGAVSVQDAGAQLAAQLLAPRPGDRVLDACAAPGGKTGHLLELGVDDIELVAIDCDAKRMDRVSDNLRRLSRDAELIVADLTGPNTWWDGVPFQRILLDAPCSASGVIRRHPDIKLLRRENDLAQLSRRQQAVLSRVWQLLAPGGTLLYSTCSVFREENEQVIQRFLLEQRNAKVAGLRVDWGHDAGCGRQILPGEGGMDGFFYCLLEKPGSGRPTT